MEMDIARLLTMSRLTKKGNAIKYILRWDKKNGVEDLEKAKVYIDKIIEGRKEK